ncbi:MAG: DUF5696 domain-containing protein [Oscillospiraceae bacterium]|nr:DUF5696 domain-containing protein [Oscillospiraceae bacterium]
MKKSNTIKHLRIIPILLAMFMLLSCAPNLRQANDNAAFAVTRTAAELTARPRGLPTADISQALDILSREILGEHFEQVAENEQFIMFHHPVLHYIAIVDKHTGRLWTSNPLDVEDDDISNGAFLRVRRSLLQLEFIQRNAIAPTSANSFDTTLPQEVQDALNAYDAALTQIRREAVPTARNAADRADRTVESATTTLAELNAEATQVQMAELLQRITLIAERNTNNTGELATVVRQVARAATEAERITAAQAVEASVGTAQSAVRAANAAEATALIALQVADLAIGLANDPNRIESAADYAALALHAATVAQTALSMVNGYGTGTETTPQNLQTTTQQLVDNAERVTLEAARADLRGRALVASIELAAALQDVQAVAARLDAPRAQAENIADRAEAIIDEHAPAPEDEETDENGEMVGNADDNIENSDDSDVPSDEDEDETEVLGYISGSDEYDDDPYDDDPYGEDGPYGEPGAPGEDGEPGEAPPAAVEGSVSVTMLDNGIRLDKFFNTANALIPITFTLTDDGFEASILFDEVQENYVEGHPTYTSVANIRLLPFFGAGGAQDEGYMLIPDGAGALINFNNGKTNIADRWTPSVSYTKPLYSNDLSLTNDIFASRYVPVRLPMFGMVKNGGGFIAEVTSGAALSTINAVVAGLNTSYNQAFFSADYRSWTRIALYGQMAVEVNNVIFIGADPAYIPTYTVNFRFAVDNEENPVDYVELANLYRDQLIERGLGRNSNYQNKLYVDFFGGVTRPRSFLGFNYTGIEVMTSFEQAEYILNDLRANGVGDMVAFFNRYTMRGGRPRMEVIPHNALGGQRGFINLVNAAADMGIPVFPSVNVQGFSRSGDGFSRFRDTALATNFAPAEVYPFGIVTNVEFKGGSPWYMFRPELYERVFDRTMRSLRNQNLTHVLLDENTAEVYSNFARDGMQRDRQSLEMAAQIRRLHQEGFSLAFDGATDYMIPYADFILGMSLMSSQNVVFDAEVPFLPILLKGYVNFSGLSIGVTDLSHEYFLRHIETGAGLRYTLTYRDNQILLWTTSRHHFSMEYNIMRDQIIERYSVLAVLSEQVGNATITGHQRLGDLAVVEYSNGVVVKVNYGSNAATYNGVTVPPLDWVMTGGGR